MLAVVLLFTFFLLIYSGFLVKQIIIIIDIIINNLLAVGSKTNVNIVTHEISKLIDK